MTKIMLPNDALGLRLGFAALYVPEAFAEGEPAYQGALIIPPTHKVVKLIDKTYLTMATADKKWGNGDAAKAQKMIDACMKDRKKSAWQKAEYTNEADEPYDGFEDAFYLRARNEIQPLLLDHNAEEVGRGASGAPYGGCYANVQVDLWLQANTFGKALRCKLLGVQFVRDGDAFAGGARASKEDFRSLAVGQDDDDDEEADEFA
jgi:hypothetical protein